MYKKPFIHLQWFALDKDFIAGVFEGATDEQVEKVLKEADNDVTGLKLNQAELKKEKEKLKEKLDELTTGWGAKEAEYKKQLEELDKQVKSTSSDDLKKYYEAEIKKAQDMYKAQLEDAGKKVQTFETEKNQLYGDYLKVLRNVEFEKAAEKIGNLDQTKKGILRDLFFTRNNFDFKEVDGVKKFLNVEGYRDVNDSLQSFIGTDEGKFFLLANGTGGGATGSASVKSGINNPYKKETFNLTEQMRLEKEKPELAQQLKSQAG